VKCLVHPCPHCEPAAFAARVGPIKSVPGVSVRRDGNLLQGGMVPGGVRMGSSDEGSNPSPASSPSAPTSNAAPGTAAAEGTVSTALPSAAPKFVYGDPW
jgi:hypothetical protein